MASRGGDVAHERGFKRALGWTAPAKRLKRLVCFSRSFILKLFRIYRKVARIEQRTLLLFSPRPRVEMFALISQWVCWCMHTHTRALAHSFPSGLQSALPQIWALQQNRRSLGPGETRGPEARPTGSVRPVRAFPFLVQGPVRKLCRVSLSCLGSLLPRLSLSLVLRKARGQPCVLCGTLGRLRRASWWLHGRGPPGPHPGWGLLGGRPPGCSL